MLQPLSALFKWKRRESVQDPPPCPKLSRETETYPLIFGKSMSNGHNGFLIRSGLLRDGTLTTYVTQFTSTQYGSPETLHPVRSYRASQPLDCYFKYGQSNYRRTSMVMFCPCYELVVQRYLRCYQIVVLRKGPQAHCRAVPKVRIHGIDQHSIPHFVHGQ